VILIGYRGCGKSSVGRALADRLGREFVDTDDEIERRIGRSVRDIFHADGEAVFRRLERDVIAEVIGRGNRVISVGGGAVMTEENLGLLRDAGICIWLTAPPEELLRRVIADRRNAERRPPLTDSSLEQEIRTLLAQREPRYRALADHIVETARRSPDDVVAEILRRLEACPDRGGRAARTKRDGGA
jgi:shikimate kinase